MVLDHEPCRVPGCSVHTGYPVSTPMKHRNVQIVEDWDSGVWTLEELSSFWGMKALTIASIVRKAEKRREGTPPLEVAHSL